ncbi:MAG: hypothetical protein L0H23_03370 [Luteimonas sp.]|nr:hypothetical protein [Luteimonas sp.]
MKFTTLSAAATLAIAVLAVSGTAKAGDYKSFSTSVCRANGAASLDVISYSHQGVFNTSSTESAVIICPLLNDTESTIADGDAYLGFSAHAPGGSSAIVNCNVQVGGLGTGAWSTSRSTGTIAPGGSVQESGIYFQTAGNYLAQVNLVCALGPRARLTQIFVNHVNQSDPET